MSIEDTLILRMSNGMESFVQNLCRNKLIWRGKINYAGEEQTLWGKFRAIKENYK